MNDEHITQTGFTLLELLVVIAIIAVIVAFAISNFVGARARARDVRKKSELQQLQSALRLYYNDYNTYPGPLNTTTSNDLNACGALTPPTASCLQTCSGQFAAGGTGCENVYMKLLPQTTDYVWSYRQDASGDDYCLWTSLDSAGDPEIAKSHLKCAAVCSGAPATSYVLCAD